MKKINNYIQEKLYIGKGFKTNSVSDDIYNVLIWGEDYNSSVGAKDDRDEAKKTIEDWVKKYDVKQVEYFINISIDDAEKNLNFNTKLLREFGTKEDKKQADEYYDEIENADFNGEAVGAENNLKVCGNSMYIVWCKDLLIVLMSQTNTQEDAKLVVHKI